MLNAYMTIKKIGNMLNHYFVEGCINNRITSSKCVEIINNFFTVSVLNLDINHELHTDVSKSYKNHPSILKLDERMPSVTFNFKPASEKDMAYIIQSVDCTKVFQMNNIP